MDGKHFRKSSTERYLTEKELEHLTNAFQGLSIASHGWDHADVTVLSETDFRESIENSLRVLRVFPCFIPYHAYTYGRHNKKTDKVLFELGLTPVFMNGSMNYTDTLFVNRELLVQ